MATKPRARTGQAYPLGATWDGKGVNFAVHAVADNVTLCLFDADGNKERQVPLPHRQRNTWYGYVADLQPGTLYGYRAHGRCDPDAGGRTNPNKLLLDPYARAVVGQPAWSSVHYGYVPGEGWEGFEDMSCSLEDSASASPKSVVVDKRFDWGESQRPRTPWSRTVMYEAHVKGLTLNHPEVPAALRGTYAGLASPPVVAHLKSLGITAIELLPVHAFVDDHRLVEMGLVNYWGYNSIGFFAPEARYASDRSPTGPVREFKQMVKAMHEAGIEVILDVVYNHTAEGNHLGPTLSFRGLDHAGYYRLSPEDRRYCVDYTGTGNTLDTSKPLVVKLILDSLRYWVGEMQVDGFRFDLATTLGRGAVELEPGGAFFAAIAQDPMLADVKLIAEPWDLGPNGYRVGNFPQGWAEWNGPYRDTVRSFWCQREGTLAQLTQRICGSADIYQPSGRLPTDSINLVTVHDGFTLHDLVSYNVKHNGANGEDNNDGENHNRSWNCGFEGPCHDAVVLAQRQRLKHNLLATLLLSQGTPLLLGGDEMARTQQGNNNGYCQDSAISWVDWKLNPDAERLLVFTRALLSLRREQAALRREQFFTGRVDARGVKDLTWLQPDAAEMPPERWHDPELRAVAALMHPDPSPDHELADLSPTLLCINSADHQIAFELPPLAEGLHWQPRIDTCTHDGLPAVAGPVVGTWMSSGRSIVVFTLAGTR